MLADSFIITTVGMGTVFVFILLMIVACEIAGRFFSAFPEEKIHHGHKETAASDQHHVKKAIAILLAHKKSGRK